MGEFHSRRSPSGAGKWSRCAGSIQLEDRVAEEGFAEARSEYADEGTAAHTLGAMCLTTKRKAEEFLGQHIEVDGARFEVTREMAVAVQEYVDAILEVGCDHSLVEERVSFDSWVPGESGTSDHIGFKAGVVYVDDLKYGQGVAVDAVENEQMVLYAAGVIETFDFAFEMREFVLRIHQPRAGGTSEWRLSREEVIARADDLAEKAKLCDEPDAPLVPGNKQCRFCKAAPRCPARLLELLAAITGACELPKLTLADAELMSPEQLSRAMQFFEGSRQWMNKAEGYVTGELKAGRPFPGWKLIEGESRRSWKDEAAVKADFESMGFERKDYIKESLIGITDAEKLLPKVDRKNFMATHAHKPPGKPKLVPESFKGEPVTSVGDMLNDF